MKSITIALRIWFFTGILFGAAFILYNIVVEETHWIIGPIGTVLALIGSLPVFVCLLIVLPFIGRSTGSFLQKKKVSCF